MREDAAIKTLFVHNRRSSSSGGPWTADWPGRPHGAGHTGHT